MFFKKNDYEIRLKELERDITLLKIEVKNFIKYGREILDEVKKNDKKSIAWELQSQQIEQMQKGDKFDKILQIIK